MADAAAVTEGLAPEHAEDALRILYDAFSDKLRLGFRNDDDFLRLFHDAVDPSAAIAATAEGALLGVLTLQAPGLEFYALRPAALVRRFAPLRALRILALLLLLHSPPRRDALVVDQLAVAEAARGRGVGTLLLEAAEARARRMGLSRLALSVIAENHGALRLYQRQGYRVVSTVGGWWVRKLVGTEAVLHMEKELR